MRSLFAVLFFFSLFLGLGLFSQNHWDNYIPDRPLKEKIFLFGDSVNVRKSPRLDGAVLNKLPIGQELILLQKTDVLLTQNQISDYWYKISWEEESEGYIWGGLLADFAFDLQGSKVLIKNPGPIRKGFEYKVLQSGKITSSGNWKGGALSNENFRFVRYPKDQFSPSPKELFGLQVFIFSEIEYGYTQELLYSFDGKSLSLLMDWFPGSCDPPACSESWLLFPKEAWKKEVGSQKVNLKGENNRLILISHDYDIERPDSSQLQVSKYSWNGKTFVKIEKEK